MTGRCRTFIRSFVRPSVLSSEVVKRRNSVVILRRCYALNRIKEKERYREKRKQKLTLARFERNDSPCRTVSFQLYFLLNSIKRSKSTFIGRTATFLLRRHRRAEVTVISLYRILLIERMRRRKKWRKEIKTKTKREKKER